MAWDESFTCDICGTSKLESNHWWMITLGDMPCFQEDLPARHFTLTPWDEDASRNPGIHHICGEGCATKALERFMSTGNVVHEGSKLDGDLHAE